MYRCVIFDLDGTLVDSSQGIIHGYQYSLGKLGKVIPSTEFIRSVIGAPLPYVFKTLLGADKKQIQTAIDYYRNYYQKKGKNEICLYPGIEQCLQSLKSSQLFLGVASLKREDFAVETLKSLNISHYFDLICGMDHEDRLTKKDLIWICMDRFGCSFEEAVLVGDSTYDAHGAASAGISFLPVTYGFGYRSPKDLEKDYALSYAEFPCQIAELILRNQS